MCTASWWFSQDRGYELFFNRDEQKSRRTAEPPRIFSNREASYIAPIDADRGGSWIAVNEFGLTVCLLNHYPKNEVNLPQSLSGGPTRGQLVLDCAVANGVGAVEKILENTVLRPFAPFYLLALAPGGETRLFVWDGDTLVSESRKLAAPLTTSSYDGVNVTAERRRKFSRLTQTLAAGERPALENFHDQHDPERGAYSVLMSRPDACTVSQTVVRVGSSRVSLAYEPIVWNEKSGRTAVVSRELRLRLDAPLPS